MSFVLFLNPWWAYRNNDGKVQNYWINCLFLCWGAIQSGAQQKSVNGRNGRLWWICWFLHWWDVLMLYKCQRFSMNCNTQMSCIITFCTKCKMHKPMLVSINVIGYGAWLFHLLSELSLLFDEGPLNVATNHLFLPLMRRLWCAWSAPCSLFPHEKFLLDTQALWSCFLIIRESHHRIAHRYLNKNLF